MAYGETYEEFVEKFKPKKTTDDCYTPPEVYEAVKDWALKEYNWYGRTIVRPFFPNGDYENYDYPENCVVIDNPPFSIVAKIVRFYEEHKISYFLFAPSKTFFCIQQATSHIGVDAKITYENGASISTSFVCSEGATIRSAPSLYQAIYRTMQKTKECRKYEYPCNLINFSKLNLFSKYGVEYSEDNAIFIRHLDAQKPDKKAIYGGGYLVPMAKAEAAMQLLKLNREKLDYKWELSEREEALIRELEAKT